MTAEEERLIETVLDAGRRSRKPSNERLIARQQERRELVDPKRIGRLRSLEAAAVPA